MTSEAQKRSNIRYREKIKTTKITHMKADDRTLCARLITWHMALTEGDEEPTCSICRYTLRKADK